MNYYNENDPQAAAWLRELINANLIPAGIVDDRSIRDVRPGDLAGFTQCHFFAGLGGWSYALELAGWPSSRPVWTGSCPCQPFSSAGKRKGTADDRHLWPEFFRLIRECRPATVFGEQVASRDGRAWLAGVFDDLEGVAYAVAGADLCAAGIGAPHIRQRLYWVADANSGQRGGIADSERRDEHRPPGGWQQGNCFAKSGCDVGEGVEHPTRDGRQQRRAEPGERCAISGCGAGGEGLEHANEQGPQRRGEPIGQHSGKRAAWSASQLVECADGYRRISTEPGAFPLAHGVSGRVGLLRGYGNAIVPQVAAAFVEATGLI